MFLFTSVLVLYVCFDLILGLFCRFTLVFVLCCLMLGFACCVSFVAFGLVCLLSWLILFA